ncbi:ETC complex I subunit [Nitzschia inconspicua]|uniref:NADH dehydrogenase [ubiquinone] iron-sulfur protein 4, mitochondrial n=1 Tax=Nitzschia inconspicua TaxID=303405 RepID=A0A9K3K849_9STRA|nr:ETC complex I subunit [Nitzschia inconspicua]KAG7340476.1 ETC complex I subunit [Nitzschia inconspicua]
MLSSIRPIAARCLVVGKGKPTSLCSQQNQQQFQRTMVTVKKALVKAGETEEPEDVPALEKRMEQMAEKDPMMVFDSGTNLPDPVMPENMAEVSALDPAYKTSVRMPDGRERMVVIKQQRARPNQSPLNPEKYWKISFNDDGSVGERWKNSLMGWNSTADTMGCDPPLYFKNAQEAVYFAEKRGWKYVVKEPIVRKLRDDDAQYQDNFLSQAVAGLVKREGVQCDWWKRSEAGCSHYFRPLKYHGDGVVRQHGPNMNEASVPHTASYFKLR